MKAKDIYILFMNFARDRGYPDKIVGDDAYSTNKANPHALQIRLWGARNGKMQIQESGRDIEEIELLGNA